VIELGASLGSVTVMTTQGRGHTPEEWVDILMPKIISVADTAPEPLKLQCAKFKHELRALILWHIKEAIASDRATIANRLRLAGFKDCADIMERL
jgi:hypothetical protein